MTYSFIGTNAFERDLDDILAYLIYQIKSPGAAANFLNALTSSIAKITDNPQINAISCKPTLEALEYREEFVGNYVLLYRVEDEALVAKRLFHLTQDYENYI